MIRDSILSSISAGDSDPVADGAPGTPPGTPARRLAMGHRL